MGDAGSDAHPPKKDAPSIRAETEITRAFVIGFILTRAQGLHSRNTPDLRPQKRPRRGTAGPFVFYFGLPYGVEELEDELDDSDSNSNDESESELDCDSDVSSDVEDELELDDELEDESELVS